MKDWPNDTDVWSLTSVRGGGMFYVRVAGSTLKRNRARSIKPVRSTFFVVWLVVDFLVWVVESFA